MAEGIKPVTAKDVQATLGTVDEDTSTTDETVMEDRNDEPDELEVKEDPMDILKQELANMKTEMSDKIAALEREKNGLLQTVQSERSKRQAFEGDLGQVKQLLTEKKQKIEPEIKIPDAIDIIFDDDGNAKIPVDKIQSIFNATNKEVTRPIEQIKSEVTQLSNKLNHNDTITKEQKEFNKFLSENKGFEDAYQKLEEQYKFLDATVQEQFNKKGIAFEPGPDVKANLERIIDMVAEDKDVAAIFNAKYAGVNVETVLEAKFSNPDGMLRNKRKLRNALTPLISTQEDNVTPLLNKRRSMANTSGADLSAGSILDQIQNMTQDEYNNLTDAEIDKLDRLCGIE